LTCARKESPISPTALALIAAAAVAHASWNFFAKQARGGLPFVWLAGLCAATLYAPPAALQLVIGDKSISAAGVAFMVGSGCLHSAYFTTLQRGYATGDLSVVYPLARGTGPAMSVLAAIVILGERPDPITLVGAALVVVAVLSLAAGGHRKPSRAAIGFALLTGVTIAAYTLWDAHAVQDLAQPAIAYYWGSEVTRAFVLAGPALRDRAGLRTALAHDRRAILAVGLLSPLAYILVLVALTLAPVSVVAPGREASIVIASLLGTRVLGEGEVRRRAAAAVAILAGIACLAAG
jgi:drug/metabolite transporter (DMT)-like permease